MAKTCYVRYPDKTKDDPAQPGLPNTPTAISAHKLDDYRSRGFIQCNQDGSKVDTAQPLGSGAKTVKPAAPGDDKEAVKLLAVSDPEKVAAPTPGGDK